MINPYSPPKILDYRGETNEIRFPIKGVVIYILLLLTLLASVLNLDSFYYFKLKDIFQILSMILILPATALVVMPVVRMKGLVGYRSRYFKSLLFSSMFLNTFLVLLNILIFITIAVGAKDVPEMIERISGMSI